MGASSDKWIAAVILLACVALFAVTLTFEEVPAGLSQDIPPERFPQLVLLVMAGLCVALLLRGSGPSSPRPPLPRGFYVTSALLLVFLFVHEWLGTMVSMALVLLVMPYGWGERRLPLILALALILPAAIYVLFVQALQVRFPWGVFEFVR